MDGVRKYMSYADRWLTVLFIDEEKKNLGGPDGWNCYGHDLWKQRSTFFSRRQGGKSYLLFFYFLVCVCAWRGGDWLYWSNLTRKQDSTKYQKTIEQHLFQFRDILGVLRTDFSTTILQSTAHTVRTLRFPPEILML